MTRRQKTIESQLLHWEEETLKRRQSLENAEARLAYYQTQSVCPSIILEAAE